MENCENPRIFNCFTMSSVFENDIDVPVVVLDSVTLSFFVPRRAVGFRISLRQRTSEPINIPGDLESWPEVSKSDLRQSLDCHSMSPARIAVIGRQNP